MERQRTMARTKLPGTQRFEGLISSLLPSFLAFFASLRENRFWLRPKACHALLPFQQVAGHPVSRPALGAAGASQVPMREGVTTPGSASEMSLGGTVFAGYLTYRRNMYSVL
jgi:hypothetical protein